MTADSRPSSAREIAACPDDEALVAWLAGEIDGEAGACMEGHLERCDECRALVIELARSSIEAAPDPPREAAAPLTVGARIGRHVVLDWLGAGGMGVVYAAFDPELARRVAIKVLHPALQGPGDAGAEDALLREAQALARVSHPNVVTIYDVGAHEGRVFVSMELVAGETLAEWILRGRRPWPAILARFLDAARGLAAAHAAGLVHRDFKPSNVLVGVDGRVRVTDFGLARLAPTHAEAPAADEVRSWKGTPAYMSPEQRRGERVDARSDQYSFCVALDEAFQGAPVRPAGGVPARVRTAIQRGLSAAPADRFPTMDALIAALTPPRARRFRQVALVLLAAGAGALATGLWARAHRAEVGVCVGAERKLARVWDEDRRRAVSAAFAATGLPYAGDAMREVERVLDGYAARWAAAHEQACLSTRVRREQSEELLDLRIACLEGQARELGALTELFAGADARMVELAPQAVHNLSAIESCADAALLRARVRPPGGPAARAEAQRVSAVLDRARALMKAGRYPAARDVAEPLLDAARKTGDRSLEAGVDLAIGQIRMRLADHAGADAALYDAVVAAEGAADDIVKARALSVLTLTLADHESKLDEATRTGALALAVLSRLPSEVLLATSTELSLALVDAGKGRFAEGLTRVERVLSLREKAFGPDDYWVAMALTERANQLLHLGRLEEALADWQRTAAIFERTLGGHHPQLAIGLRNVAVAETALRRLPDAQRDMRRARDVFREAYGDDYPYLPALDADVAEILDLEGHLPEAKVEIDRALAGAAARHPPDRILIEILDIAGAIDTELGRFDEAMAVLTRAQGLGGPLRESSDTLTRLGALHLAMGHPEKALDPLERAVAMRRATGMDPLQVAAAQLLLGRALWSNEGTRPRAIALVTEARDAFARSPARGAERTEAERWLAGHGLR